MNSVTPPARQPFEDQPDKRTRLTETQLVTEAFITCAFTRRERAERSCNAPYQRFLARLGAVAQRSGRSLIVAQQSADDQAFFRTWVLGELYERLELWRCYDADQQQSASRKSAKKKRRTLPARRALLGYDPLPTAAPVVCDTDDAA